MHTIIAIAVLTAMAHTQAASDRCTEYCNFLRSDQLRLFWREADCECSSEYHRTNNRHNKSTKFKRYPKLDNSAIYYEPSDEYPYQRTSFVDYPFYIVNPMYKTPNFMNIDSRKARKIGLNNLNHEKELNPSVDKRMPTESVLRSFDIESEDSPIYLDIDIYKSVKNERSNKMQPPKVKKVDITEDDLMECIDLHVLVFFRKNDEEVAADFGDLWNDTKINKYKGLSDSDLMIKIQSKCQQPIEIIHESLQQIRNSRPRKSQHKSTQNNETIGHVEDDKKENNYTNLTDAATMYYSTTEIDEELDSMLQLSTEDLTEIVSQLPTTTTGSLTDFTNTASNLNSSNMLSKDNWNQDSASKNNLKVARFLKIKPNSMAEKNNNVLNNINVNSDSENYLQTGSGSLYSNDFASLTVETTTTVDSFYKNKFNFVIDNSKESRTQPVQLENTNIGANRKNTLKPFKNDQHFKMMDKDIEIPRVFTKEFENDTVVSSVNGTELISNNDFVETLIRSHGLSDDYNESTTVNILTTNFDTFIPYLSENTKNDQFDNSSHFIQQNVTTKLIKDFMSANNTYVDNEEVTLSSTKLGLHINSITNDTESNQLVGNELLVTNISTVNNSRNKITETRHTTRYDGSTELKSSIEDQTDSPDIAPNFELSNSSDVTETWYPSSKDSESQKDEVNYLGNQAINDLKVNETQSQVEDSRNIVNVSTSLSENVTSFILTSDKNENSEQTKHSNNLTAISYHIKDNKTEINEKGDWQKYWTTEFISLNNSYKNGTQYIEDDAEFSGNSDTTPNPELFMKETQDTEIFTNRDSQIEHELVKKIISKTNDTAPIQIKGNINNSMSQSFARATESFDQSNTTDKIVEFTTTLLNVVSNPQLSTKIYEEDTTLSNRFISADISELSDDLISSENVVHKQLIHTATTTYSTRDSEALVIPNPNSTVKAKEEELGSLSQDIVGKLYFLFGENQVPVRFVQNSDGQIKLGLDGETICDKIIEKDISDSVIIRAICNCYQFKNCTNFLLK